MTDDITVSIAPDLMEQLDQWIDHQPYPRPNRAEALVRIVAAALAPIAVTDGTVLSELADRWQVGQAETPSGSRPFLALSSAAGSTVMLILDDAQALALVEAVSQEVVDPSGQPPRLHQ